MNGAVSLLPPLFFHFHGQEHRSVFRFSEMVQFLVPTDNLHSVMNHRQYVSQLLVNQNTVLFIVKTYSIDSLEGQRILLLSKASRPDLMRIQPVAMRLLFVFSAACVMFIRNVTEVVLTVFVPF